VPVASQTLQMLENLLQHPDQTDNPFELAEVLFLSGHLKEASVFYREALNRERPDQPDPTEDRPWILFQIGNCLRHEDMPTAMKMYKQLITEYPDSPWTDLAKARHKLINWYRKDKPRTLIGNPILQQAEGRL
jgi:TolA-binding protein